jgi:membrane-bound lytic murein transglycosylase D
MTTRRVSLLPLRPIFVSYTGSSEAEPRSFTSAFRIGRSSACELCIRNDFISRIHAEVVPENAHWYIQDLNSSNGLFINGKRVDRALLDSGTVIGLGAKGPQLSFRISAEDSRPANNTSDNFSSSRKPSSSAIDPSAGEEEIVKQYADRYFSQSSNSDSMGEHTMYVRRAFAQIQTKQKQSQSRQKWTYIAIIALLLLTAIGTSMYTYRLHQETLRQRAVAHDIFYAMKSLDIEIAEAERVALASDPNHGAEAVNKYESRRREMQANYDRFLASQHIYDPKSSEQHRLILRVARIFGECELDMPADFEQEINRYIKYWQSSGRFASDIRLAKEKGYTRSIPQAFLKRGLPVQFFYLAMQESNFNPYATGPITRKGFAKGMWQFIPETGVKYGLHLGPLVDLSRPDPADERDQPEKATEAASQYLDVLYSTDAQASGLLVMACYNWGEDQVLPLVRRMPLNPRERNFWRLLVDHRSQIPKETYDYVFYITAAAVIGENPRLFGFDFDNPLDNSPQSIAPNPS